jgi:hypothetical protein
VLIVGLLRQSRGDGPGNSSRDFVGVFVRDFQSNLIEFAIFADVQVEMKRFGVRL